MSGATFDEKKPLVTVSEVVPLDNASCPTKVKLCYVGSAAEGYFSRDWLPPLAHFKLPDGREALVGNRDDVFLATMFMSAYKRAVNEATFEVRPESMDLDLVDATARIIREWATDPRFQVKP